MGLQGQSISGRPENDSWIPGLQRNTPQAAGTRECPSSGVLRCARETRANSAMAAHQHEAGGESPAAHSGRGERRRA